VGLPAIVSWSSSVIIFMENGYLEELLETFTAYFSILDAVL
jgi:hypothetical protein